MFLINRLTDVLVRLVDLAEAEGRLAKLNALRFVQAIILTMVGGALAVVGVGVLMYAVYQALRLAGLVPPLASLISAIGLLGIAALMMAAANQHLKNRKGFTAERLEAERQRREWERERGRERK